MVESFPLLQENAQVGPLLDVKYTNCPLGPFQNAGDTEDRPDGPRWQFLLNLVYVVRFSSADASQVRLGSAVYPPIFVVLTT